MSCLSKSKKVYFRFEDEIIGDFVTKNLHFLENLEELGVVWTKNASTKLATILEILKQIPNLKRFQFGAIRMSSLSHFDQLYSYKKITKFEFLV